MIRRACNWACIGVAIAALLVVAIALHARGDEVDEPRSLEGDVYVFQVDGTYDDFIRVAAETASELASRPRHSPFPEPFLVWVENLYWSGHGEFRAVSFYGNSTSQILNDFLRGRSPVAVQQLPSGWYDSDHESPTSSAYFLMFYRLWGDRSLLFVLSDSNPRTFTGQLDAFPLRVDLDSIWFVRMQHALSRTGHGSLGRIGVKVLYDLGSDFEWTKVDAGSGYDTVLAFLIRRSAIPDFKRAIEPCNPSSPPSSLWWKGGLKEDYYPSGVPFHHPTIVRVRPRHLQSEEQNERRLANFLDSSGEQSVLFGLQFGLRDGTGLLVLMRAKELVTADANH